MGHKPESSGLSNDASSSFSSRCERPFIRIATSPLSAPPPLSARLRHVPLRGNPQLLYFCRVVDDPQKNVDKPNHPHRVLSRKTVYDVVVCDIAKCWNDPS